MIHFPAAVLIVVSGAAHAAAGASPSINEPFQDPDFAAWVERFERSGREVYDQRERILAATDLRPGMSVADIGAGTGLFTLLFAKAVGPTGKVYAVDISREFVRNVERRANAAGFANVTGVVNSQNDVGLAPGSIDLAFICDTYHHFEKPAAMLQALHRALRPGGRLVIVDFRRISGKSSDWVMEHVRAGEGIVTKEVAEAGFAFKGSRDILRENYFLLFERK